MIAKVCSSMRAASPVGVALGHRRDVDRDHELGAHLARVMHRDRRREAAVDVLARADPAPAGTRPAPRSTRAPPCRCRRAGTGCLRRCRGRSRRCRAGSSSARCRAGWSCRARTSRAPRRGSGRGPGYDQSANAVSSIASAIVASSRPLLPDANSAATRLPADVPTTRSGAMPFSSSAWITPMWAKPRAAPPPSARPMRGRRGGGGGGGGGDGAAAPTGGGRGAPAAAAGRARAAGQRRRRGRPQRRRPPRRRRHRAGLEHVAGAPAGVLSLFRIGIPI